MALPQEKCYSMADVLDWDGQERIELVDGYPVMMA
ncbi:MAG: Uma2 family endonuclease, partial [Oscillospiraceae bacterium]|nr:Uma2 family endonuclease [Oscillospiraceae bacterium]